MTAPLPPCCPRLETGWPFPAALPSTRLVCARFDEQLLQREDFVRCGLVLPDEQQRAVPKRQAEFLAGRLCAREALRQLRGDIQAPGKRPDGAPAWPAGIVGSITHSKRRAAAVVGDAARWKGLGLDAEATIQPARAERLAGEILTPAERRRLRPDDRALQITLAFSFKESLFKALYPLVGKRFYFEDAELLDWRDTGHARLRLLKALSPNWRQGAELDGLFSLVDGHLLTLVAVPT